jgi:L-ascorbate metabolism protein UlaG (beta-lactamase superfamily)
VRVREHGTTTFEGWMAMRIWILWGLFLAACSEVHTEPPPRAKPPRATLTYLGVAGWSLDSDTNTLLFDPYVTRSPVSDMDLTVTPDHAAIERFVPPRADLIVVSHSHWDHVLDVPAIALRTNAVVLGTESTAALARASHVPAQHIVSASGGEELVFKGFRVRVVKALHSLIDDDIGISGTIAPSPQLPLRARDYQEGGTLQYFVQFAGHRLYFVGTANFLEDQLRDVKADIAIIATGLRDKVPDYTCRLMRALGQPKLVLVNHFDAFKEPLTPGAMTLSDETRADLAAFEVEVHRCAPESRVIIPSWLEPIPL